MNLDYTGSATKLEPTREQRADLVDAIHLAQINIATGRVDIDLIRVAWDLVAHQVLTAAAKAVISDVGSRDFNQGLLHAEAVLKALRGDK